MNRTFFTKLSTFPPLCAYLRHGKILLFMTEWEKSIHILGLFVQNQNKTQLPLWDKSVIRDYLISSKKYWLGVYILVFFVHIKIYQESNRKSNVSRINPSVFIVNFYLKLKQPVKGWKLQMPIQMTFSRKAQMDLTREETW